MTPDTATREIVDAPGAVATHPQLVPIDLIRPAPDNLRGDWGDLDELVASIRGQGLWQRILLCPIDPVLPGTEGTEGTEDDGCQFVCVDGHRRLEAARRAGVTRVPADVRRMSDADRVEAMLVTALQRQGLTATEQAAGIQRLIDTTGLSQHAVAKKVGLSQPQVSKLLALLKLPEAARAAVDSGGITQEQGVSLAKLTVEETEALFAPKAGKDTPSKPTPYQIEDAVRTHDLAEKIATVRAQLEATGVAIVDGFNYNTGPWLLNWIAVASHGAHESEPCHAVIINSYDGRLTSVCTDRDRHKVEEDEALTLEQAAAAERERQRAAGVAQREADVERRKAYCQQRLTLINVNAIVALAAKVLPNAGEIPTTAPLQLLGVEPGEWHERPGQLVAFAAGDVRTQAQALYAVVLAAGESLFGPDPEEYWRPSMDAFVAHLVDTGYALSDLEREWAYPATPDPGDHAHTWSTARDLRLHLDGDHAGQMVDGGHVARGRDMPALQKLHDLLHADPEAPTVAPGPGSCTCGPENCIDALDGVATCEYCDAQPSGYTCPNEGSEPIPEPMSEVANVPPAAPEAWEVTIRSPQMRNGVVASGSKWTVTCTCGAQSRQTTEGYALQSRSDHLRDEHGQDVDK